MNRFFLVAFLFMCWSKLSFSRPVFSNEYGPVIAGHITGLKDGTLIFLINAGEQKTYDTAVLVNNEFVLRGPILDEPLVLFLQSDNGLWTSMVIGNDQVRVVGDVSDFPWGLRISGSKTEDVNQELKKLTKNLENRRDQFVEQYLRASEENKRVLGDSISLIDSKLRSIQVSFIKEHPNTHVAALTLGSLRNKLPKEEVSVLFDLMSNEIKESGFGQVVQKFLETNVAKIGEAFTDFEAIDQKDHAMKLSDVKSKYILLDFTASYCAPCRQSAEELRKINGEYKGALTVVSVSADASKDVWLKSLRRDKVSWLSLWDGKGSTGGAVLKYNASKLPAYVLIDVNRKIVDKWYGYSTGSLKGRLKRFNMGGYEY